LRVMFCTFIVRDFWTLINAENADFFLSAQSAFISVPI
jgi:hypothetical protein